MTVPTHTALLQLAPTRASRDVVREHASGELFFAVVGHVGSGTSEVAKQLQTILCSANAGPVFDVHILKAREVIEEWAHENDRALSSTPGLTYTQALQDIGDAMRATGDHAAVARALIRQIRSLRASKTNQVVDDNRAISPDGAHRAYILDSIRHPAEVQLLSHIYQDAFVLIGVVCDDNIREDRLKDRKYRDAGVDAITKFMRRDAKSDSKHGQRVADAFHLAHFFLDNTEDREVDGSPNPEWRLVEQLTRLKKILTHHEVVRPDFTETAMFAAQGAQLRSACLSRQVGASIVDRKGNVVALGTNEVPRAGGGVYGGYDDDLSETPTNDHRCAYRPEKYCSNSREQQQIIDQLVSSLIKAEIIPDALSDQARDVLKASPITSLLEFSRAVHAEMDALISLARRGHPAVGTRVFVTTFPCHYCARHLVAAGVDEVQYIEPYPKSKALELHKDSIEVRSPGWVPPSRDGKKVLFRPFVGVAPRLYSRVFTKVRDLKSSDGSYRVSEPEWAEPTHLGKLSYIELEMRLGGGT